MDLLLILLDYYVIIIIVINFLLLFKIKIIPRDFNQRGDYMRCPYRYKYQLVDWLCKFDKRITRANANRKTIKQLYWLYYNLPELINSKGEQRKCTRNAINVKMAINL